MICDPMVIAQAVVKDYQPSKRIPSIVKLDLVEAIAELVEHTVLEHLIDLIGGEGDLPVSILLRERYGDPEPCGYVLRYSTPTQPAETCDRDSLPGHDHCAQHEED